MPEDKYRCEFVSDGVNVEVDDVADCIDRNRRLVCLFIDEDFKTTVSTPRVEGGAFARMAQVRGHLYIADPTDKALIFRRAAPEIEARYSKRSKTAT